MPAVKVGKLSYVLISPVVKHLFSLQKYEFARLPAMLKRTDLSQKVPAKIYFMVFFPYFPEKHTFEPNFSQKNSMPDNPMQNNSQWAEELELIATILSKTGLSSTIKWGAEVYTFNGKNIVSYGGFKNFVSIWFYNGVFLSDPYKVLVTASDGKTKSLRQWRFTSADQIAESKILEYVREAVELEQKGLKLSPEKHQPVEIPEPLASALQSDTSLKSAFEKLTSGKQKEYCLYLAEAKQEATKFTRLEKITPMILQGIGLNDKYKKNC